MKSYRLNIIIRGVTDVLLRLGSFITFPIMTKYLGATVYGINEQISTMIGLIAPLVSLGLGISIVRFSAGHYDVLSLSKKFLSSIFWILIASSVVVPLLILFASSINHLFIKVESATAVIQYSAVLICLNALGKLCEGFFRSRQKIGALSVFQIIQNALNIVAVAVVLMSGRGLLALIKVMVFLNFSMIAAQLTYLIRPLKWVWAPLQDGLPLIKFGFPLIFGGLGLTFVNIGDRVMLGYFLGAKAVGIYSAAYAFGIILVTLASPFNFNLYPQLCEAWNQSNLEEVKRLSKVTSRWYSLIALPSLVGLTVLGDMLLRTLATGEFVEGSVLIGIVGLGIFLDQVSASPQYILFAQNKTAFVMALMLVGALLNAALNFILIPFWGMIGAAVATLLTYLVIEITVWLKACFGIRELIDGKSLVRITFASIGMGFFVFLMKSKGVFGLLSLIMIGVVSYSILLVLLGELRREDLRGFRFKR